MTFDELNKLENEIAATTQNSRLKLAQVLSAAAVKAQADYTSGMQKILEEADAKRADILKQFDAILASERDELDKKLNDALGSNPKAKPAAAKGKVAKVR